MTEPRTWIGRGLPYINVEGLTGRLIVVEGSDSVGRSTQLQLLRNWLEVEGYGVIETGWTRSALMAQTMGLAKEGHRMNVLTFNLLYATDFADRLEHEIIPALRAGFVVLSDRYVYTAFARAMVRGADRKWIRNLFGFALQPDIVLYLKADVKTLVKRALLSRGLDYWESGLDQNPGLDPYESFRVYQTQILRQFDEMAKEMNFVVVNARYTVNNIQKKLRAHIKPVLADVNRMAHDPYTMPPLPESMPSETDGRMG